jgi:hypothetical protein
MSRWSYFPARVFFALILLILALTLVSCDRATQKAREIEEKQKREREIENHKWAREARLKLESANLIKDGLPTESAGSDEKEKEKEKERVKSSLPRELAELFDGNLPDQKLIDEVLRNLAKQPPQGVKVHSPKPLTEEENPTIFKPSALYPWNNQGFKGHNNALLESMRKVMVLDVSEESLPAPLVLSHNRREMERRRKLQQLTADDRSAIINDDGDDDGYVSVDVLLNETTQVLDESATPYFVNVLFASQAGEKDLYDTVTDFRKTQTINKKAEDARSKRDREQEELNLREKQRRGHNKQQQQKQKQERTRESENNDNISSDDGNSDAQQLHGDSSNFEGLTDHNLYDEQTRDVCMMIPTGYWTYELCHGKSIKQFHYEHDPARPELGAFPSNLKSLGSHGGKMRGDLEWRTREGRDVTVREVHRVVSASQLRNMQEQQLSSADNQASYRIVDRSKYTEADRDPHRMRYQSVGEEGERVVRITDYYTDGDVCEAEGGHPAVARHSTVTTQCCSSSMGMEHALPVPADVPPRMWHQLQELLRSDDQEIGPSGATQRGPTQLYNPDGSWKTPDNAEAARYVTALFQEQAGEGQLSEEQASIMAAAHLQQLHREKVFNSANTGSDSTLQPASVMRHGEARKYRHELISRHGQHMDQPGAGTKGHPLEAMGHIGAFVETSRCGYHFVVCSPELCHGHDHAADEARRGGIPVRRKEQEDVEEDDDDKEGEDDSEDNWGAEHWEDAEMGVTGDSTALPTSPAGGGGGAGGNSDPSSNPTPRPTITPTTNFNNIASNENGAGSSKKPTSESSRNKAGPSKKAKKAKKARKNTLEQSNDKQQQLSQPATDENWSLTQVLNSIINLCLVRQEEWWTYELCFKHGVRQFHLQAETTQTPSTKKGGQATITQQMVVTAEFSLGNAPAGMFGSEEDLMTLVSGGDRRKMMARVSNSEESEATGTTADASANAGAHATPRAHITEGEHLVDTVAKNYHYGDPAMGMAVSLLQRSYRPRVLTLTFSNGTPCDIETLNRSIDVRLTCGDSDQILSITEDHTCHYVMSVQSKQLCNAEGFRTPKRRVVPVEFVPRNQKEDFRSYLAYHIGEDPMEEPKKVHIM